MTPGMLVLAVVYGTWLLCTVAYQFPGRLQTRLGFFDLFGLLPSWSFFAPNPGTTDYRLIYRDFDQSDSQSDWREVTIYCPSPWRAIWNPTKHRSKAFSDICQSLFMTWNILGDDLTKMQLTWPYLSLLAFVSKEPQSEGYGRRQFAIVATSGYVDRTMTPLFVSAIHRL